MHKIIVALLLGFMTLAHAQVYKCADSSGKTIFSDKPCDAHGAKGGQVQRGRTADEIYQERMQALDASERKYQRRAAEREQQMFDQQMNAARQRQAIEARPAPQRQSDTVECKKAQKELDYVSSIRTVSQDEKRMRTNAAITSVNAACGSNTPLMQEPPKIVVKPSPNHWVTSCNGGFCTDANGNTYTRQGSLLTDSQGRTCNLVGNQAQCH